MPNLSTQRRLPAPAVALAALAMLLLAGPGAGAAAAADDVTYNRDVAPILQRSCETCHRPGSIAPMSLQTYEEIRPWARNIRDKITRPDNDPDRMPPWFIEKNIGVQNFKEDISLSP